jgi:alpha-mannosidase
VIASGPIAIVVESVLTWKRSVARLRITFYREYPYIDIDLLVNWGERRRALQLELSAAFGGSSYETEIPHAAISRPRGGGEEPSGRWVSLTDAGLSLALVNDGPGGVEVTGGTLRQTLVRSPVYCSGTDTVEPGFLGEHMDLGEHRYRFRLLFGDAASVTTERQLAVDDLNLPFSNHTSVPLKASDRTGVEPGTTLVDLSNEGKGLVHLEAMKVSEDGRALVVRLAERAGAAASARIRVDGIEPADLSFRPYEMKTLRCEKDADATAERRWVECDLLERPLHGDPSKNGA